MVSKECEKDGKLTLDNIMMIVEYSDSVSGNVFDQVFTPKVQLDLQGDTGARVP